MDVTGRETTMRLPADTEPASVVLDPGVWLLADFGAFTRTPGAPVIRVPRVPSPAIH